MQTDDSSATFMTAIYSRIKKRQGAMRRNQRDCPSDTAAVASAAVDTNLGPALLMGAASWLLLFFLYRLLA